MRRALAPARILANDERGATLVEFGFVAPVLCLMLMGGMDIGHTLYMQAQLQGIVQKAARDSALESGTVETNRTTLDNRVRTEVQRLNNKASVTFSRQYFASYRQVQKRGEDIINDNGNNICDPWEFYIEENNVPGRQADMGQAGQGGAKDAVIYRVDVSYRAMFPLWRMLGRSEQMNVSATTILRNQPYGEQRTFTPVERPCV